MSDTVLYPHGRILIFCKAPQPGRVKTRLARSIGDEAATTIHRHLAHHCLRTAVDAHLAPVTLFCSPDTKDHFFLACQQAFGVSLHNQEGADLGERMRRGSDSMLESFSPVLLIGSDCPAMTPEYLRLAMAAASEGKTVLGPAEDGGYVLLGMSEPQSELFIGIDWGCSRVFTQTLAKISGKKAVLDTMWDVDHVEDLKRLRDAATVLGLAEEFQDYLNSLERV